MYERLLGGSFELLPEPMRTFHRGGGVRHGEFSVVRGRGILRGLWASIMRMPPSSERVPVRLEVACQAGEERWTRTFGDHVLQTTQRMGNGRLTETVGPLEFDFIVTGEEDGMRFQQQACRYGRLVIPHGLSPKIAARAVGREDGWHVEVAITMPLLGLITRYEGEIRCP
jgi:hypothetical protein